ncbi:ankyrin repeat domain-containing protein, partial [Legionella fairfieldensis]|uniref:ankyrin repeat domain-containing protein n=1 Tax=Legionella fairfieldensis TaxID=45064 RepID=UPI001A95334C
APKVKGLSQADQRAINPVDCFTDKRLLAMFKRLKEDFWTSASGYRIKDHLNTNQEAQAVFFACLVNHYELIDLAPLNAFLTYKPIKKNKKLLSRLQKLEDIFTKCRQQPPEFKMVCLNCNLSIVHIAAYYNKLDWIQWLHSFGANLNLPDSEGKTPVFYASQKGFVGVIRLLNTLGADINQPNNEGRTPLYVAAQEGRDSMVRTLIASGANVNQSDKDGWTPLLIATKVGHYPVVRTLIESGANVNQSDKTGCSPLYVATVDRKGPMIRTLLELGANVNQPDPEGWTPALVATAIGLVPEIKMLSKAGANVNQPDNDGFTPLCIATMHGNKLMMETLVELGADPNAIYTLSAAPLIRWGENVAGVEILERIKETISMPGVQDMNDKVSLSLTKIAQMMGHKEVEEFLSSIANSSSEKTRDRNSFFSASVEFPVDCEVLGPHNP